jgi:glycine hydroxymethyltransferase
MSLVVDLIDEVINNHENETVIEGVAEKVNKLMSDRPLFQY